MFVVDVMNHRQLLGVCFVVAWWCYLKSLFTCGHDLTQALLLASRSSADTAAGSPVGVV